jgi:hypothetical protein
MKRHMQLCQKEISRVHRAEKPSICAVCNTSFSRQRNMKRHMQLHTNGNLFKEEDTSINTSGGMEIKCENCSFSTESKEILNLHLTSHQLNIQINYLLN